MIQEEAVENILEVFGSRDYIVFLENFSAKIARRDLLVLHAMQKIPLTIELPLTPLSYHLMIP
jgi:hypothetical protein